MNLRFWKSDRAAREREPSTSTAEMVDQQLVELANIAPGASQSLRRSAMSPSDACDSLALILDLVAAFDTDADRGAVAMECYSVLGLAEGDHASFSAAIAAGREYFLLGEMSEGGTRSREYLRPETAVAHRGPYTSGSPVHLSVPRSEAFAFGNIELLGGERVYKRIAEHVAACESCERVVAQWNQARRVG